MGTTQRPLDPHADPVQWLACQLQDLRDRCGRPSYRDMARRTSYSASMLSRAAAGRRLPSLEVTLAFAQACGGDPRQWEQRWRQARVTLTCTHPGAAIPDTPPAPAVARRSAFVAHRRAAGVSQLQLAERLGVARSTVERWEAGQTSPQPRHRTRLAEALRISTGQLTGLLGGRDGRDDGWVSLSAALTDPVGTDPTAVTQFRRQLADLDLAYEHMPSASLLPAASWCLGQVSFLARHATGARIRQDLWQTQAQAAIITGQLAWDASRRRDHVTAMEYFRQAIVAAQQAARPADEGVALVCQSSLALNGQHDPHSGFAFAARARSIVGTQGGALTGLAVAHAAKAEALLGDRRRCERALGRAEAHFSQAIGADVVKDPRALLGCFAGWCYLALGVPGQAELALRQAASRLEGQPKSRAAVLGHLALALLWQRQIDEAAAALDSAVDLIAVSRDGGGPRIAFAVARKMQPWLHVAAVKDACDRLLTVMP